ncbi:transcriptional adapter 2B isoform X2 [Dendroctonus ponderosae]|uniref:transcriptional adapter 2B isoform X2 n=1 Tax=Dendroctonus ponderosae TaxID=77166 RepID=UPI0020352E72|nr:transcriptional adapter 2B isoform X2 [Dendroctonus ponderosae]KAH1014891.1 hypothetical protein HUJ05_012701 [Dendroctonus ponderosae]KAH1014892.1 hypothetical protein HUJ05_012701 [Dendroctonus ponderosae]
MADLLPKVTCTYCQEDINGVRVQCCECQDFDICLQCFASGAEIGTHKNDHPYRFVDHGSVSIFGGRGSWTGREQLKLLEAAELYSYANWDLMAEQVGTRTAEECREEFTARYLDGNIGKVMWGNVSKPNLVINLAEDEGPLSPAALAKLPPLDATLEEAKILGYKPHRDDFEREYNPEAEQLVAHLQLEDNTDSDVERVLKLAVVDMYIRRLRERQRRKRIVRDYQLVAKYFDNLRRDPSKPLYPKEQKELRDCMRPFAQFLNAGEHEQLITSLERERELRDRLTELKRYRSLGLTTQEEIVHYEQHAAFQRQQIRQGKAGGSGLANPVRSSNQYLTSPNGDGETKLNFIDEKTMWLSGSDSAYDSGEGVGGETMDQSAMSASIWTQQSPSTKNSAIKESGKLAMESWSSQGEVQWDNDLNIQPLTYVTLKSVITQENLLNSDQCDNTITQEPNLMDININDELIQFLGQSSWLPDVSTD